MLLLSPFISKSDSSAVECSPRNPWIGGSNPGGNYTSFSASGRVNPFSSENCSFCTLRWAFTHLYLVGQLQTLTISKHTSKIHLVNTKTRQNHTLGNTTVETVFMEVPYLLLKEVFSMTSRFCRKQCSNVS